MATALSPPAGDATALSPPKNTSSPRPKYSPGGHALTQNRLSAAADLIRNLDAALSDMTHAASSAAEDAAKARRNARAAGEVARRYGASVSKTKLNGGVDSISSTPVREGGSLKKNRVISSSASVASASTFATAEEQQRAEQRALEKKRERRAATRLAAEARYRREMGLGLTGTSGREDDLGKSTTSQEDTPAKLQTNTSDGMVSTPLKKQQLPMEQDNGDSSSYTSRGNYAKAPAYPRQVFHPPPSAHLQTSADTMSATDGTDLSYVTLTGFEDALDQHTEDQSHTTAPAPPLDQLHSTDPPALTHEPTEKAPPLQSYWQQHPTQQSQDHYYNQQQNYYQQHGQEQTGFYQNQPQYSGQTWDPNTQPNKTNEAYEQQNSAGASSSEQAALSPKVSQPPPPVPPPSQSKPPQPPSQSAQSSSQLTPSTHQTSSTRIAASHAEDVLTLSLELERTRATLASTTSTLTTAQSRLSTLQSHNDHLQSELDRIHSELETTRERSTQQVEQANERYQAESIRAKAAEEDAALALELAKEAQAAKEEVEAWLARSLEEIDLWKGRANKTEMESNAKSQSPKNPASNGAPEAVPPPPPVQESRKVRFADESPPSPVTSVASDDGNSHGNEFTDAPPPPSTFSYAPQGGCERDSPWHTPDKSTPSKHTPFPGTAPMSPNSNGGSTPTKIAVASGRAWLHRASPGTGTPSNTSLASISSPGFRSGLSPHPRLQATELMKRSAETRRILRERLGATNCSGAKRTNPTEKVGPPPPPSLALVAVAAGARNSDGTPSSNDNSFASRQGAACRAVGKAIRESGNRLDLEGKWWGKSLLGDGGTTAAKEPMLQGVAELESMVKDYCGNVEGTIGRQKERIEELVAFCDHLEKEVIGAVNEDDS